MNDTFHIDVPDSTQGPGDYRLNSVLERLCVLSGIYKSKYLGRITDEHGSFVWREVFTRTTADKARKASSYWEVRDGRVFWVYGKLRCEYVRGWVPVI